MGIREAAEEYPADHHLLQSSNTFSRPLTHHQQLEAIKRLKAGKETLAEIARSYNVSRWTISRLKT
jgi:hypothetical protein